ncbi:hypothetical protein [Murdochiella massiliensis]|uniref:hypothetical protein n=1 Tax=Murdochiella massiliensis TaxID=1673723 RepID=UPI00082F6C0E|nr:hypothetical protein [Murdochiella massiliensis]
MRYDKRIFFVSQVDGEYDQTTGDYLEPEIVKTEVYAAVHDTNEETLKLLYGDIRQKSFTVHILGRYEKAFRYILIDGKSYHVDLTRRLRHRQTFIVSEVQNERNQG